MLFWKQNFDYSGYPIWAPSPIVEFFFGDQIFFVVTILQLKVAKRQLFEKVSLERWKHEDFGILPTGFAKSLIFLFLLSHLLKDLRKLDCVCVLVVMRLVPIYNRRPG